MDRERPITHRRRDENVRRIDEEPERPCSRRSVFLEKSKPILRPPSASVYSIRKPQSASRTDLSTGLMPPEREAKGSLVIKAMKDRLASEKGVKVGNVRTATSRGQVNRHVQDKRFFIGTLHLKIGELNDELANLHSVYNEALKDHGNALVYDKRVKELAAEITDTQGILANYNLAVDRINIGYDVNNLNNEAKELLVVNETEIATIESIFSDRLRRQESVNEIEKKLLKEKNKSEQLISEMGPEMSEQFYRLKQKLEESINNAEKLQTELESLTNAKASLNEHIYIFPTKNEAITLESKLLDLRKKWENMKSAAPMKSTEEEKESLLQRVKYDNSQILIMETAIKDLTNQIKSAETTLSYTKDSEDNNEERHKKYLELRAKEEVIEDYLAHVELLKHNEMEKLKSLEEQLLHYLERLKLKLVLIPTPADYKLLQNDLSTSEILSTAKSIGTEHKNLLNFFNKIEIMEANVRKEFNSIISKTEKLKDELEEYTNSNELDKRVEIRKKDLINLKSKLDDRKTPVKEKLRNENIEFNKIQKQLAENENHAQISYLEKKISTIGQNNFLVNDYAEETKAERDVKLYRENAIEIVRSLNMLLRSNVCL